MLDSDLKELKENVQFKISCGEVELLPFVQQAIKQTEQQLEKLSNNNPTQLSKASGEKPDNFKSIKELNHEKQKMKEAKIKLKEQKDLMAESHEECHYFF